MASKCVSIDERIIQNTALPETIFGALWRRGLENELMTMHGFDRSDVGLPARKRARAHFPSS